MGKEEILAYQWNCDFCGRMKILPGNDNDLPYDWIEEDILAFCCWSHRSDWHKLNTPGD